MFLRKKWVSFSLGRPANRKPLNLHWSAIKCFATCFRFSTVCLGSKQLQSSHSDCDQVREYESSLTSEIYTTGTTNASFAKLDDITSIEKMNTDQDALLDVEDEESWRNKLMFKYEFTKTPRHLTWAQLGHEVECLEMKIDLDKHRPEEIYRVSFWYLNRRQRTRTLIFHADNDASESEGLTDLLAAIGTCLSRPEVHRTIRFDNGKGEYRELNLRKTSRYTSDVTLAFRPEVRYNMYERAQRALEAQVIAQQITASRREPWSGASQQPPLPNTPPALSPPATPSSTPLRDSSSSPSPPSPPSPTPTHHRHDPCGTTEPPVPPARPPGVFGDAMVWGFHPALMDPEYRDPPDPPGTYHLTLSSHALCCVVNRALERLLVRPLGEFYRPSRVTANAVVSEGEDVGLSHAVRGWLGAEGRRFPHYTPLEAVQSHWLGPEAPFHLTAIICRLRSLGNLTRKNPELLSWWSVRMRDSAMALRNLRAKMLGAGPSTLFLPASFYPTINQMLPREQRKRFKTHVSLAGLLGYNDETKNLSLGSKLDCPTALLSSELKTEKNVKRKTKSKERRTNLTKRTRHSKKKLVKRG